LHDIHHFPPHKCDPLHRRRKTVASSPSLIFFTRSMMFPFPFSGSWLIHRRMLSHTTSPLFTLACSSSDGSYKSFSL
jgi:hypothetical protein